MTTGDCPTDGFYEFRYCGWTATDACGNVDSLFFYVVIYDNSPPVLSPAPGNVLVSCDAGSLARDVRLLREHGYHHVSTEVFDVFANTSHVETVTRFDRANGPS